MTRCEGRGYPGCDSCINKEYDPFECEDCDDESNWEGDESDEGEMEDISVSDFALLFNGNY